MSNGSNMRRFYPRVTGFANQKQRMNKTNINLKVESLKNEVSAYVPQPTKFEGYSNFPRPLSRPYTNKMGQFKAQVVKVPKSVFRDKFMDSKNNFVYKNDKNFKTNNVGVSYLTSSFASMTQSVSTRKTVINDFGSSKLIKSMVKNSYSKQSKNSNNALGRVIKLQHALSNNTFGDTVHGRKLTMPKSSIGYSNRSSSVMNQYMSDTQKSGRS